MKSNLSRAIFVPLALGLTMALVFLGGCDTQEETGTVTLSITDAPTDAANVAEVNITVAEIQYNVGGSSGDNWQTFEDFQGPKVIDLLSKTDGIAETLGQLALPAGNYTQIRFILDGPAEGTAGTLPGCWIAFSDATPDAPLFIPSAYASGFKAVGAFQVPVNGDVAITADFDLRNAVRISNLQASPTYVLRPTLRLLVDDVVGRIVGVVSGTMPAEKVAVFAYEDGTYLASEADVPADESTAQFAAAATSAIVKDVDGTWRYTIAFLAPGVYDLVVASLSQDPYYGVLGYLPDITVESQGAANGNFDITALSQTLP